MDVTGTNGVAAGTDAAGSIAWTMYIVPLISGLISLAAIVCLVLLVMKKSNDEKG